MPERAAPASDRFLSLDAIRGAAVIGIAFMNVAAFAMPFAAYDDPRAWGGRSDGDLAAWLLTFVLVDGKMRALFSALFGASLLLVIERAGAAGRSGVAVHLRRMAWLVAIGLLHGLFVWFGDILLLYALVGALVATQARRPTHELIVMALICFAVPVFASATGWVLGAAIPVDRADLAADLALHRSGYGAILLDRVATQPGEWLNQILASGLETAGLMLGGMAGLRSGFLTGAWTRASYVRVAAVAYLVGLPPLMLTAAALLATGFDERLLYGAVFVIGALCRPVVALGHAALLLWWLASGASALKTRLAAAGRMALTNYLATSLLGTTLYYGYGLALFGRIGRVEQLALATANGLLILGWSAPWLARFRYGPAEWAWRSLARWRIQAMGTGPVCIDAGYATD